jgi:uncharacterized protein YacL
MNICLATIIFLIISFLGIITDIYIFGFYFTEFIKNIIITLIIAFITNWACYTLCYNWVSWLIVIINLFLLFAIIYLASNKNEEIGKTIIEEEKQNRNI